MGREYSWHAALTGGREMLRPSQDQLTYPRTLASAGTEIQNQSHRNHRNHDQRNVREIRQKPAPYHRRLSHGQKPMLNSVGDRILLQPEGRYRPRHPCRERRLHHGHCGTLLSRDSRQTAYRLHSPRPRRFQTGAARARATFGGPRVRGGRSPTSVRLLDPSTKGT